MLAQDRLQGLVGRAGCHGRLVGEVVDDQEQILGGLLPRSQASFRVFGASEQLRFGRFITATKFFREQVVLLGGVSFHLSQKSLDRSSHQLGATEGSHMAENVSGVKPLFRHVDFECPAQLAGHVLEDLVSQFIIAKQFLITLYGA